MSSQASSSPLDKRVKDKLVTDMFHMVGIVPGDRCIEKNRASGARAKGWGGVA